MKIIKLMKGLVKYIVLMLVFTLVQAFCDLYLPNLMTKYNYQSKPYVINPIIGEYDDPEKQMQGLLTIDLTNTGNLLVYGIPGSGKENLVTTLVSSICASHSTDEVNVYLLDFGAETLGKFRNFPQVGDYVFIDDTERINSLITFLSKEINRRKTLFAPFGGTYSSFIESSGKSLPNIICVIHQFEAINDGYSPLADKFINLFKDGPKMYSYGSAVNLVFGLSFLNLIWCSVYLLLTMTFAISCDDMLSFRYSAVFSISSNIDVSIIPVPPQN